MTVKKKASIILAILFRSDLLIMLGITKQLLIFCTGSVLGITIFTIAIQDLYFLFRFKFRLLFKALTKESNLLFIFGSVPVRFLELKSFDYFCNSGFNISVPVSVRVTFAIQDHFSS